MCDLDSVINKTFIVLVLFFGICTIFSCVEERQKQDSCLEIASLTSDDDKIEFLENIWQNDQEIRKGEIEVSVDSMNVVDGRNLQFIRCYITQFEYPEKSWGYKANLAPWVVVHHSGSVINRRENFDWLYEAYQSRNLDEKYFLSYLDRFFTLDKGERFDMGATYNNKDRIEKLIKELNLQ